MNRHVVRENALQLLKENIKMRSLKGKHDTIEGHNYIYMLTLHTQFLVTTSSDTEQFPGGVE